MTSIAEYIPIIVSVSLFCSVILLLIGILQYRRAASAKRELMEKIRHGGQKLQIPDTNFSHPKTEKRFQGKVLDFLDSLGKRTGSDKAVDYSRLRPVFLKAGFRRQNAPSAFWGAKFLLAVFLPVCFAVFKLAFPDFLISGNMVVAVGALLALAGFYLPNIWLHHKIDKRKQTILNGFPDALDLLVVCVEAGMGLDSGLLRVAKEIELENKILSYELNLYNLELRAGKPRQDALKNLAMRIDLDAVNNLVTLLIQTDRFGTSVSQALKIYSDTLRTQRFQRAEEMAAKLPVKLLFPLILFIFPAIFVAILGPAVISIYRVFLHGGHF
ncbi:MAG: type II secretion system F family protein [Deltaproteobacteria bacterium]|nr:type II secretion system F family protein [Deltaproteobacteria bacterium]